MAPLTTPPDCAICPRPVFIIGSPRSGTTILAHSLARHSQLWASAESDFLYYLFGDGLVDRAYQTAEAGPGVRWLHQEAVAKEEFLNFLGIGLNALFTSRSGGKRWVDQTPLYTLMAPTLAAMFPGAQFIHMLRDGRRVVASMLNFLQPAEAYKGADERDRDLIGTWTSDFTTACRTWRQYVEIALDLEKRFPGRVLTITNEALVQNSNAGFARILDFLGAPHESAPAEHLSSNRINSSFRPNSSDRTWVKQLSQPWLEWSLEQKEIFAQEAGEMLVRCGFATEAEVNLPAYDRSVLELRRAMLTQIPAEEKVLVASKGDEHFVRLAGRTVAHFPQDESGGYLGGNPANGAEGLAQLQELQAKGFDYFVMPAHANWWLDHYADLGAFLRSRCRRIWRGEAGMIFCLSQLPEHTRKRLLPKSLPERLAKAELPARYERLFQRNDLGVVFEDVIRKIYESILRPGMCAVDGGANAGDHTLPLAQAVLPGGRVFAFEPLPQMVSRLRGRIARAGLDEVVVLREVAIGNREGETSFTVAVEESGSMAMSGLVERRFPKGKRVETSTIDIHLTTLDRAVPEDAVIAFIKLDLEGGELHALCGAERILTRDRPLIVFECARGESAIRYGYSPAEFFAFFVKCGYRLTDLFGVELTPELWDSPRLPWYAIAAPCERSWDDLREVLASEVFHNFPELDSAWFAAAPDGSDPALRM